MKEAEKVNFMLEKTHEWLNEALKEWNSLKDELRFDCSMSSEYRLGTLKKNYGDI